MKFKCPVCSTMLDAKMKDMRYEDHDYWMECHGCGLRLRFSGTYSLDLS